MTDNPEKPDKPDCVPEGAIHLGTFNLAGKEPGTYTAGVFKLYGDPEKDLLGSADSFRQAADRCLNGCKVEPGVEMLTVPAAVCAAFAVELYLKYIHLAETGKRPPKGHKLVALFCACSAEVQEALRKARPDLASVLARNDEHFVAARYHHETGQFSFRQQELLQLAESFSEFIRNRYRDRIA